MLQNKKWLTYWVIFGLITLTEHIIAPLLFFIPFYHIIKLLGFVYLFLPITNGAQVVFERIVNPLFVQNKDKIESLINNAKQQFNEKTAKLSSKSE